MESIGFEESPCVAHRSVSLGDVANRPIHLAKAIELLIGCIIHLAYAVMRSIFSIYSPVAFLSNEAMKALILLIIDDP